MRFSASLGFLWPDLPLADAIRKAAGTGFDAVECHWPYDDDPELVAEALAETGLPMVSLNTLPGDSGAGEFGLAAIPGRKSDARAIIRKAFDYAQKIGCLNVHVMAGCASGDSARGSFLDSLQYAADLASASGIGVVIEPLNTRDIPDYFLTGIGQAAELIEEVGAPEIRVMFDCYHQHIMTGDVVAAFRKVSHLVAHVQFASLPDRAEPDHGDVEYRHVLKEIQAAGYSGYFGAEYKPVSGTFGWLKMLGK